MESAYINNSNLLRRCCVESWQIQVSRLTKMNPFGFSSRRKSQRKSWFAQFRSNLPSHNEGCENMVLLLELGLVLQYIFLWFFRYSTNYTFIWQHHIESRFLNLFIVDTCFFTQLYIKNTLIYLYENKFIYLLYLWFFGKIWMIDIDYVVDIESHGIGRKYYLKSFGTKMAIIPYDTITWSTYTSMFI